MPKRVFWPATLVIMGLIFLASNMGMFPAAFWNLWPLILIIVGLGGLLTSDTDHWMGMPETKMTTSVAKKSAKTVVKKSTKKKGTSRK